MTVSEGLLLVMASVRYPNEVETEGGNSIVEIGVNVPWEPTEVAPGAAAVIDDTSPAAAAPRLESADAPERPGDPAEPVVEAVAEFEG